MKKMTILKGALVFVFVLSVFLLFYYSGLHSKSYNTNEVYNVPIGTNSFVEENRTVLVTENSNLNG
ncbi:hypothetical protein [Flavobacterium sp. GCM10023249]